MSESAELCVALFMSPTTICIGGPSSGGTAPKVWLKHVHQRVCTSRPETRE